MKRWWLLTGIALVALSMVAPAQDAVLEGYVRDDLQLISQQSIPAWTARWTGPIEAATILAWLADHGYSQFVRDYNRDGVIDEQDTIQLADDLGRMLMGTNTPRGTTDVRLVLGLAQYVAGLYPDEFVLKIYDVGFPSEVRAEGFGAFSPDMVPGIVLEVKPEEPNIDAYEVEMVAAEGVILGLCTNPDGNNTYLAGRSFLYEKTREGHTPIDLALSEEDRWQAGIQGQVLETVGTMNDTFFLDFRSQWTPVEFMLALSPLEEPPASSQAYPCPDDAIAYDVTVNTTTYGRVSIEECVTREQIVGGPTLDTYTYSLTNIDFLYGSCGVCLFFIPNVSSLVTVMMTAPGMWTPTAGWGGWWWVAPSGSCGIRPGEVAVFSFTVIGPTTDTWVSGSISGCLTGMPTIAATRPPMLGIRTTGPGKYVPENGDHSGDCTDLMVAIESTECTRSPAGGGIVLTIVATVTNIGAVSSPGTFIRFESDSGNDTGVIPALDPGESSDETFTFTCTPNDPPPCPVEFTVTVDPYKTVTECREDNNETEGEVMCPGCIG
jgi:hypothetical protein